MKTISLKDLSPAQQRLLQDMIGTVLKRTPQGWFAKGHRAHQYVTIMKLGEYRLIQEATDTQGYELSSIGHDLAVGNVETVDVP